MEVAGGARADVHVPYILVHSDREIRRLSHQAGIINPITRRILLSAGISAGMRVLDVGCGAGDVTFLVSEMVGSEGQVIGADLAPAALAAAEGRAAANPIQNVSFREGDPAALSFDRPFDAVIGRYVLMFQADAVAMLRGVARHLRPGGTIVFHEPDWDGCRSSPPAPTYDDCCRWIVETFRRSGIETNMGIKLDAAFRAAGLTAPSMHLEAVVGGTKGGFDWSHQTAELIVTMLPEIQSRGVATAAEVDIETLGQRMQLEIEAGSVIVSRSEVGAWSRAPN
ncbi:MAG: class I SAM-dependent methyltransferase [Mesorhizobium sp.]|uniref:class I SAM-dependent methyltransferase n=1 Tax=Mesorhizobium sp. TaxID=1871066 RepID=UPI00122AA5B6|nr:methyltransferase domain-containing protein [Mesorhizobium sp.]TIL22987.1 MAG: class I SAM-dependent methyltransferase [Mesorhizobium sp.]